MCDVPWHGAAAKKGGKKTQLPSMSMNSDGHDFDDPTSALLGLVRMAMLAPYTIARQQLRQRSDLLLGDTQAHSPSAAWATASAPMPARPSRARRPSFPLVQCAIASPSR